MAALVCGCYPSLVCYLAARLPVVSLPMHNLVNVTGPESCMVSIGMSGGSCVTFGTAKQSAALAAAVMSGRWQCSAALGGPVRKELSSSSDGPQDDGPQPRHHKLRLSRDHTLSLSRDRTYPDSTANSASYLVMDVIDERELLHFDGHVQEHEQLQVAQRAVAPPVRTSTEGL